MAKKMVSGFKQSEMNQFDGSLLQLKDLLEKMGSVRICFRTNSIRDPGRHNSDRNSLWTQFKEDERANELEVEVVNCQCHVVLVEAFCLETEKNLLLWNPLNNNFMQIEGMDGTAAYGFGFSSNDFFLIRFQRS
ncbi:trichohyalin-like [Pyrus ussuriensis x Pyrus communis]|uniref:Trichohyalin-like n=1 Tax=Pyrus ussuriensis x Pyrus communis TaxID=2448454 RepID=A0A5N5HQZ7_9ROSA|nr:trichohyalin-like [Pyrus ussuriensis x Pyrus communis]